MTEDETTIMTCKQCGEKALVTVGYPPHKSGLCPFCYRNNHHVMDTAIECLHSAVATIDIELATIKAQIERLEGLRNQYDLWED